MKVLILGSEGFIGRYLISFYVNKGYEVFGADIILTVPKGYTYIKLPRLTLDLEEVFKNEFDLCINAAGSGDVSYSINHPVADFEANTLDVVKFLDGLRRYSPGCKYIHISSAAVYGNPRSLPVKETDELKPLSPYGWNKWISELVCKQFSAIYSIKTAIVRPFSVYGPGLRKQVFWDTYQKYLKSPHQVEMWGTGNETRDFIYIEDLVRAIDIIAENGALNGDIFNLASGIECSIKQVIDLLFSDFPDKPKVIFNQNVRAGDPLFWKADIQKIKDVGFISKTTIDTGIKELATWLRNQN